MVFSLMSDYTYKIGPVSRYKYDHKNGQPRTSTLSMCWKLCVRTVSLGVVLS